MTRELKIVSGGQTGVDRGALDAALSCGVAAGGWCPEGRLAEDGPIDASYPLDELPGAGYAERTARNVEDSDGTLIVYFGALAGGTELTLACCIDSGKPYLLVDACEVAVAEAVERARSFVEARDVAVLNVAGPRASEHPRGYGYALELVRGVVGARRVSRSA